MGWPTDDGTMWIIGACHNCGRVFWSNPNLVPSTRLDDGRQVMFCRPCVEAANPIRRAAGLDPIPLLEGTYP